ncbi:hypothetical protein D3C86_1858100 [compost metagenome]
MGQHPICCLVAGIVIADLVIGPAHDPFERFMKTVNFHGFHMPDDIFRLFTVQRVGETRHVRIWTYDEFRVTNLFFVVILFHESYLPTIILPYYNKKAWDQC